MAKVGTAIPRFEPPHSDVFLVENYIFVRHQTSGKIPLKCQALLSEAYFFPRNLFAASLGTKHHLLPLFSSLNIQKKFFIVLQFFLSIWAA